MFNMRLHFVASFVAWNIITWFISNVLYNALRDDWLLRPKDITYALDLNLLTVSVWFF